MSIGAPDVAVIRRFAPGDEPGVLALLKASLAWNPNGRTAALFGWKHRENPFGPSAAWVAVAGDRIVGFRAFLRWEFIRDSVVIRAVRAVDTATHPDYQRCGIFSRLTRHALEELSREGVAFVFNTPNNRSLPGYLKMGWREMGRMPIVARPGSLASLVRTARARVPAERWSAPTTAGLPAADVLADGDTLPLLNSQDPVECMHTHRTLPFLRWRYGTSPFDYRVLFASDDVSEGLAIFRIRRRGKALEAALCELVTPSSSSMSPGRLAGRVIAATGADYGVLVARPRFVPRGFVPLPRHGPVLACRSLTQSQVPDVAYWRLNLGDVEAL